MCLAVLSETLTLISSIFEQVANQKNALEGQKTGLERNLSSELINNKGKHSKQIAELQVRLEETVSDDLNSSLTIYCHCSLPHIQLSIL